jgi:hypothetical protein
MNDLCFAFRQLLKNPGFTAVAVLGGGCASISSRLTGDACPAGSINANPNHKEKEQHHEY